ncbi:PRC-barrel domain-containing protein [Nitrospira sp. T9]|uniref:PRC-barrel domain-containing protein n=1 Tax=unclassified Nitrospira TaxID=2652172 RepID=UPI003F991A2B
MNLTYSHTTVAMVAALCMASPWLSDAYGGSKTMREKLKSTIGGSEYVVTGEIINVEGNNYTLKTSGGETFQLETTNDTNMFCKSNSNSSQTRRTSASGQGQQAQSQQSEFNISVSEKQAQSQQSQERQQSVGFRIGDCPFEKGDTVKAELTDVGTVTFIRSIDDQDIRTAMSEQNFNMDESMGSGRSTREMGLPQEYIFLPAGALGSMHVTKETEQYQVTTSDGEQVGQVYKVMLNNHGDPAYVIVRMKEDQQLKPVPWQALQISPETQSVTIVLSRAQMDQLPGYSSDDMSVRSIRSYWELAREEKDRRATRQSAGLPHEREQRYRDQDSRYDDPYEYRGSRQFREEGHRQDRRYSSNDRDRFRQDRFADRGQSQDDWYAHDRFGERRYRNDRQEFDDYGRNGERNQRGSFYSQGRYDSRDQYFDDGRSGR